MRRLTLILSDLYLPAEAARQALPAAQELPGLEWLLRFARVERIDDWRRWLAVELRGEAIGGLPIARARAMSMKLPGDGSWIATPVALEVRLDHVRLRDRGLLRLPADQRQALRAEFMHALGPELALHEGQRAFLLSGGPTGAAATRDPARLLDSDISGALPSGSTAAAQLRRLGTEIELWLHGSAINAAREKAGQRRISALWLWGGGPPPADTQRRRQGGSEFRLFGGDDHLSVLNKATGDAPLPDAPRGFADLAAGAPAYVEFAPMSGPAHESLGELEARWFTPARAALLAGGLDALTLVANDRVFTAAPRAGWKFWRRRRSWLESLA